jgi:hypothetical protein
LFGMRCENAMLAIFGNANDADPRDAREYLTIVRRQRDAATESAHVGDGRDLAQRVDSINLTRFAAGPEIAIAIKRAAFWMVQPAGEDLESVDRYFWFHCTVQSKSSDRAEAFTGRDVDSPFLRINSQHVDGSAHVFSAADAVA